MMSAKCQCEQKGIILIVKLRTKEKRNIHRLIDPTLGSIIIWCSEDANTMSEWLMDSIISKLL